MNGPQGIIVWCHDFEYGVDAHDILLVDFGGTICTFVGVPMPRE